MFRSDARVLPFGQVPVLAYFSVLLRVMQTRAFDFEDHVIFVSPLPHPPVFVVARTICDLLTQNLAVVLAPCAVWPNSKDESPIIRMRQSPQRNPRESEFWECEVQQLTVGSIVKP
jgi:hypothetical protein